MAKPRRLNKPKEGETTMATDKPKKPTTEQDIVNALAEALAGLDELLETKKGPEAQVIKGWKGSLEYIHKNVKAMTGEKKEAA